MKNYFCLLIIGLIGTSVLFSQNDLRSIDSYKLGEKRSYRLYVPEDYDPESKYPLLVVFDGDYLFDLTVASVKFFRHTREIPPCIVLGIPQKTSRNSDVEINPTSGFPDGPGAAFFEFLGMELIPKISKDYELAPFKAVIGHGLTANFSNYYLFKEEPLFSGYITLSPTLPAQMEQYIPERLSANTETVFYYLATSKNDEKENRKAVNQVHLALKDIEHESLKYYYKEYDNADHHAIAAYAIPEALDRFFETYNPISIQEYRTKLTNYVGEPYEYLAGKYDLIEELYGIRKPTTLNDFMAVYSVSKKKEKLESLEALSKLAKKEFPDTMLGFFVEAEYLELSGEPKKAMRTYEKAFSMPEIDFLTKDLALERIDQIKEDFGW